MTRIPKHLAIIMDGNGRWAQERGLPRIAGHYEGVKRAEEIVYSCQELGVEFLTLYTFSTENWKRPTTEVKALFELFESYLSKRTAELRKKGIRLRFIGRKDRIPRSTLRVMREAEEQTKDCNSLTVILAVDYGGRDEIVRAINKLLKSGLESITEEEFSKFLDLANTPDPDLLIRTAGEERISNFLLWHIAYTEFYFSQVYWPDFTKEELMKAIEDYSCRKRRFGAVL
ncbi:isoprenyl transferase [Thermocrinis sp.]